MSSAEDVSDQIIHLLAELGLNEYETRAYLTILEGGVVVAREVSDHAGIPYAKVYQTLSSLINKQMIIGDEGRPKRFHARKPSDAIEDRLNILEQEFLEAHNKRKSLANSLLPLLENIYNASGFDDEQEQGVWNISGLTNVLSRVNKLMRRAQQKVVVVVGDNQFFNTQLAKILDQLEASIELIIISAVAIPITRGENIVYPQVGEGTTIIIDQTVMMTIVLTRRGKFGSGEYLGLLIQVEELVSSYLSVYESLIAGGK